MNWQQAQEWEKNWWQMAINTYGEETKQLLYAEKMGLKTFHDGKSPFNFDMEGKKVLDIGGGPVSLLLKCINVRGKVIDPCDYPQWIYDRYKLAGIEFEKKKGEDIEEKDFDECWIYNVLQHVENPEKVIKNALGAGKIVRIFEWIDTPANEGHPHCLTEEKLNEWLGGTGKVEELNLPTLKGRCYYGIFKGDNFERV